MIRMDHTKSDQISVDFEVVKGQIMSVQEMTCNRYLQDVN